jgi:hypothetical protein
LRHQSVEVPLSLAQGQGPQVDAILVQQVENHELQGLLVGPAGAQLGVEPAKIRLAAGVDETELAVEHGRARRQVGEPLCHAGQAVGVLGAALGEEPHVEAVFHDLEAITVPFGLVEPILAGGRAGSTDRGAGSEKHGTHRGGLGRSAC